MNAFLQVIIIFSLASSVFTAVIRENDLFELSVIHINDFHARFLETNIHSGSCKPGEECIGGFPRLYYQIMRMFEEKPDSVLLNAGDDFQGTMWYTIGKWNVTKQFMNKLPFAAQVLGNHEFDDGIDGVVPYIKALKHPVIVSNIDDSLEPTIQGLYTKSVVVERKGKKIGIIGVIIATCPEISSTGKLKFLPESASVNAEAERLVRDEGVFTNIVLSHSGYELDKLIASNASEKISLIVGGHSHFLLYTGENPPGPDIPKGPYPTIVRSKHGHAVLITQASCYNKYLGNITVYLNKKGEVADFSGEPIFLSTELPQDETVLRELEPWREAIDSVGEQVVGQSLIFMDKPTCYRNECTLGNFFTDAMVFYYTRYNDENSWTYASIAMVQAGGMRTTIEVGNITFNDLISAAPFENNLYVGQMKGKHLKDLLEYSMAPQEYRGDGKLLHLSGIHVVYDLSHPLGNQVVSVKLRCQNCTVPIYEDLNLERTYRIIVPTFLRDGGDGYTIFRDYLTDVEIGPKEMDAYLEYLSHRWPVFQEIEGRIVIYSR